MSERDAILFANSAFYAAFAARDMEAMEKVWAKGHPVSCIHPGWRALTGRKQVMESWQAILSNPGAPRIVCRGEKVLVHGDLAIVTCIEQIPGTAGVQYLMATNVFVRTGSVWSLVHHQAGELNDDPGPMADERKPPLN